MISLVLRCFLSEAQNHSLFGDFDSVFAGAEDYGMNVLKSINKYCRKWLRCDQNGYGQRLIFRWKVRRGKPCDVLWGRRRRSCETLAQNDCCCSSQRDC